MAFAKPHPSSMPERQDPGSSCDGSDWHKAEVVHVCFDGR